MSVTILYADEYFSKHLDKAFWTGLTEETKTAAIEMGTADVAAVFEGSDVGADCPFSLKAICEQAVFLARNYSKQTEGKIVTGQGLSGMTQNFTLINSEHPGISPRALAYIKQAKASMPRIVRIGRG